MKLFQQCMALFLSWSLVLVGRTRWVRPSVQRIHFAVPASGRATEFRTTAAARSAHRTVPGRIDRADPSSRNLPGPNSEAGKWMEQHKDLHGDQLAQEVDKQSWDPSVKALAQFPAVLANMNQNLAWTSELGDTHVNQRQELTQAIQVMRERAKEAGNLNTTTQE